MEQRKSFRINIPEGREHATLIMGKQQLSVHIIDESAGGFAVALLTDEDVQQNQVRILKTATGLYETRVARVEHFEDGKLLGLMRLSDLSNTAEKATAHSWRDFCSQPSPTGTGNGMPMGLGLIAVAALVACCASIYFMRRVPVTPEVAVSPLVKENTEALTKELEKLRSPAKEAVQVAKEKVQHVTQSQPVEYLRQQARVSQEVLYRLQLDSEQSRRIRNILSRTAGDLSAAEVEIRSVLTAEQARKWDDLAP